MKRGKKSRKRTKNRSAAIHRAFIERIKKRPLTRKDQEELARTRQLGLNLKAKLAEITDRPHELLDNVPLVVYGTAPTFDDIVEFLVNLGLDTSLFYPEDAEECREAPDHIGRYAHGHMSEAFIRALVDLTNEMELSNLTIDENGFIIGVALEF